MKRTLLFVFLLTSLAVRAVGDDSAAIYVNAPRPAGYTRFTGGNHSSRGARPYNKGKVCSSLAFAETHK